MSYVDHIIESNDETGQQVSYEIRDANAQGRIATLEAGIDDVVDTATAAATQATQAAQTASDAAQRAEDAIDAIDAIGDISELAVPEMSKDTRGGAKLEQHGGLALRDGALGIGSLVQESDGYARGGLAEVTAKGHAEQVATTGKNLLRVTVPSQTKNGVTFTVNADGSVTANGTATSGIWFKISDVSVGAGTYTLSGCPADGSNNKWMLYNDGHGLADKGSGATATFAEAQTWPIYIKIADGIVCSDLTFRPQLELGSTATEYEPYTGGAPSPSPDYPQEIQVVTGHEVTGKTGRFVDLVVKQGNTTLSTTPIPLPQRGWVAGLPDGTADSLRLDGAGKCEWELKDAETTTGATDGVTGTIGVDVLSTTGQIADGATVLYKLATPVTEDCGYVDMPAISSDAQISIPELDALGIRYFVDDSVTELARQWYERANSEYADRITALEQAVAELATS